jgi:hypothetical protein
VAKRSDRSRSGEMWFVHGYVRTSAGAKIYGWINKKMLAQ